MHPHQDEAWGVMPIELRQLVPDRLCSRDIQRPCLIQSNCLIIRESINKILGEQTFKTPLAALSQKGGIEH